jgi:hypothetical protein
MSAAQASVRLHRALYAEDAIRRAAETFTDFAAFAVRADGEHWLVDVSEIDQEVEGDVVAEFCNFALANTAIRRKKSNA